MRRLLVLVVAVSALGVLTIPQIANAQSLGRVDDNILEVDGQQFPIGDAVFGPLFDEAGVCGDLQVVGGGGSGGCYPIAEDLASRIALIDRGVCAFTTKVANAEAEGAGAVAVVIINDGSGNRDYRQRPYMQITMAPVDPTIGISSGIIARVDGDSIRDLTSEACIRKATEEEWPDVLNGWLGSLAMLTTDDQFFEVFWWVQDLEGLGYLKSSHSKALINKLVSGYKQFYKGNLDAVDSQFDDFAALAADLGANGHVNPAIADALVGASEVIRAGLDGTQ